MGTPTVYKPLTELLSTIGFRLGKFEVDHNPKGSHMQTAKVWLLLDDLTQDLHQANHRLSAIQNAFQELHSHYYADEKSHWENQSQEDQEKDHIVFAFERLQWALEGK